MEKEQSFFLVSLLMILSFLSLCINGQQNYSGNASISCSVRDPSAGSLYTCNGENLSCQAFLIYTSRPFFDSVPTISALFSADQEEVAMVNDVTRLTNFVTDKEVIVPVNCSCFGQYYQANTTFHVTYTEPTYYVIANDLFQGLSPCSGLMSANPYGEYELHPGLELKVPVLCACPTASQSKSGTEFLLTYSLGPDDNVPDIAHRFSVSEKSVLDANGLEEDPKLYDGTTILIPLPSPPLSSQTIIRSNPQQDSPPSSTLTPGEKNSKRELYEYVGLACACTLLVSIVMAAIFVLYRRKRRDKVLGRGGGVKEVLPEDLRVEIASFEQVLKVYGIGEIKKATDNFSSKHRIKGVVYYGEFDGEMLAVKKMSGDISIEVNILKKIQHFNLIKLRGICENGSCFYLVFEYMKNGSLREWLSGRRVNDAAVEGWNKRIQIALDIANGLYYLHSFSEPACIHKDITSSNVLLDSELRGKIANFSFARATAREESINPASTEYVVGTRGYMAPEYLESGLVSPKIDVYAFGVVLSELITGKEAIFKKDGKEALLSSAIVSIMQKENAEAELGSFVDPALNTSQGEEFAHRLAKLSLACLSAEAAKRPSMEDVVCTLLKIQADFQKSESAIVADSNDSSSLWQAAIIERDWRTDISK